MASRRVIFCIFIARSVDHVHHKMDIFAAALDARVGRDAMVDARATPAPSQDIASAGDLAARSGAPCMVIEDDPEDGGLSIEAGIALVDTTVHKALRTKRTSSHSDIPCVTKRKCTVKHSLRLTPKKLADGDDVTCVLVQNGRRQVPVPLWSQYNVNWKDLDFQNSSWIVVSNYEHWFMQLVDAVTNKSVRLVAKTFTDHFRNEFQACMAVARTADNLGNPVSDSDCDEHRSPARQRVGRDVAVTELDIGGFTVLCLNSTARMVLKLDEATVKFITGWIVPLVKVLAHSQDLSQHKLGSPSASVACEAADPLGVFRFSACPTPNIRDKVCWNLNAHAWSVLLKDPKGKPSEDFAVDHTQSADAYEEQKIGAYGRAIEIWNRLDGSKRLRIPITNLPRSTAGD